MAVDVVGGVARVSGTDTIAGSTATMDQVFRFAVAHSGLPRDDALSLGAVEARACAAELNDGSLSATTRPGWSEPFADPAQSCTPRRRGRRRAASVIFPPDS